MLEIFFFFVPNTWRKWNIFFHFFISTFTWLLMLTILSTESCLLSYLSILLGAYKLVAYKKCKALIFIIIPVLALYNINLLTELDWEWRQIRYANVKKYCVIIMVSGYFPWIFSSGQQPPGQLPPIKFSPRKLPSGLLPSG